MTHTARVPKITGGSRATRGSRTRSPSIQYSIGSRIGVLLFPRVRARNRSKGLNALLADTASSSHNEGVPRLYSRKTSARAITMNSSACSRGGDTCRFMTPVY
jgi:hypothetical protein